MSTETKKIDNVSVRDDRFKHIKNTVEKLEKRAEEFCQTRSSFQIEKFIAFDEFTPVSMYRHLSHNAYVMSNVLKETMLDMEILKRDLEEKERELNRPEPSLLNRLLGYPKKPRDLDIQVYKLKCSLKEMELKIKGLTQELEIFNELINKLIDANGGNEYTYEDFEKDQPEYWRKRLSAQMYEKRMGAMLGIGEGNYEAYLQASRMPLLEGSKNIIEPFIKDIKQLDGLVDK